MLQTKIVRIQVPIQGWPSWRGSSWNGLCRISGDFLVENLWINTVGFWNTQVCEKKSGWNGLKHGVLQLWLIPGKWHLLIGVTLYVPCRKMVWMFLVIRPLMGILTMAISISIHVYIYTYKYPTIPQYGYAVYNPTFLISPCLKLHLSIIHDWPWTNKYTVYWNGICELWGLSVFNLHPVGWSPSHRKVHYKLLNHARDLVVMNENHSHISKRTTATTNQIVK